MTLIRAVDLLDSQCRHAKCVQRPDIRDKRMNWPWTVSTGSSICRTSVPGPATCYFIQNHQFYIF